MPAVDFRIDIILSNILEEFKNNQTISEVVFLIGGEFKVYRSKEQECFSKYKNIYELNIPRLYKLKLPDIIDEEEPPLKKRMIIEID